MLFNKKEVIKHSSAVQISNKVSLLQRKVWNLLLANAFSELGDQKSFSVHLSNLYKALGFNSNNDRHLKDSLEALVGCTLEWNVLEKDKSNEWGVSSLLSEAIIKDAVLTYEYSSNLQKKLHNPNMYAKISLSIQNTFSSKHSLALYELFVDFFDIKRQRGETPYIELQDFRLLLGLADNEYALFKDLNKSIVKKAITEINKKTDLYIEVDYQSQGRRVTAIKFIILKNRENKNLLNLLIQDTKTQSPVNKNSKVFQLLQNHGFTDEEIKISINSYSEAHLLKSIQIAKDDYQNGKVKKSLKLYTKAVIEKLSYSPLELEHEAKKSKEQEEKRLADKEKKVIENFKEEYSKYRRKKLLDILETLSISEKEKIENEFEVFLEREHLHIFSRHFKDKKSIYESSIVRTYFFGFCSEKLLEGTDDFIGFVKKEKDVSVSEIEDNKYRFDSLEELKNATLQLKLF